MSRGIKFGIIIIIVVISISTFMRDSIGIHSSTICQASVSLVEGFLNLLLCSGARVPTKGV